MHSNKLSSFLVPIRLRYLFLVALILGGVFFSFTYWGIKKSRQSLLNIMVDQGKALARSLILSSNNAIQSGLLLQSLSEQKLAELAETAKNKLARDMIPEHYRRFCSDYDLKSIDILDSSLAVIASNRWAVGFIPEYPDEVQAEIIETIRQGEGYHTVLSYSNDSAATAVQYFIYEFAPGEKMVSRNHIMVLAIDADYLDRILRQIGIGYLIQEISHQAGIEYIFLQTRNGIIFSSRQLPPILSIDSDPFLDSMMISDTIRWRIHPFARKDVLEIASRFESVSYPPGIFRIGLNLDDFHELSSGYDRQIIVIAVILFLLTLAIVAVVSVKQNYFLLDRSYRQIQSMTETIFDRLTSAVLAYDASGKILAVNASFCALTGLTHDIIGKSIDEIKENVPFEIPGPDNPGEMTVTFEKEIESAQGERKAILFGCSRLPEKAGGGIVLLLYDISERKRLEEENRRRERLSEMGDMAAGVAHEIRNPLNAIGIAAQRLQLEFAPKEGQQEYDMLNQNILSETARLNDILTRFLDLAKRRMADKNPIDISDAIHKAVDTLQDEAGKNQVNLSLNVDSSLFVRGEIGKYQQVFINLIKNAIQAMPSGGTISITASRGEEGQVHITVADSGPGFPKETMGKIFQPYFTTKADGSGLGLALAYKTITDFGGSIEAANGPTGGAVIHVFLPIVE